MAIEVIMPQMGESIVEGAITRWLKKPGDSVEKDEPLFEISTDKVDAEIPSPAAGILTEIRVPEGATVTINTVVGIVTERNEVITDATQNATPAMTDAEPPLTGGTDVVMPQMGESIVEGTITKWLKQVGDRVEQDEPLFEITTDKVDAEIPAPVAGVLSEIRAAAGQTVQVNMVVAVLGGALKTASTAASAPATSLPVAIAAPVVTLPAEPEIEDGRKLRSSPLVRRIAKEKLVDLRHVRGTGSAGRITKEDILKFLEARSSSTAPAAVSAKTTPTAPQALRDQVVPLSRMRAIIAERMVESRRISPHAHTIYKIDMTRIVQLRAKHKNRFEQTHGVKLTYMPFIATAVVEALKRFPVLNASLIDGSIHYHGHVHLGIAVALEWGLIVPVIRNAEEKSFVGMARAIADLAARARTKKLQPDEAFGSTFTLTNAGSFGGVFGTPIINQPESAILAIGGLNKEPAVLTDADGNDSIAIRSQQYYCLGLDHRIIDGADSGRFMSTIKDVLEGWNREIL